jgi:hypothetical protein
MTSTGISATVAADARIHARHPFATHLRRDAAAEQAAAHRVWTPADGPLPSRPARQGEMHPAEQPDRGDRRAGGLRQSRPIAASNGLRRSCGPTSC